MLFHSFIYIVLFLPLTCTIFFALNHLQHERAAKLWLIGASLLFYAYWNPVYLPLMLVSMGCNYLCARGILTAGREFARMMLVGGVVFNLGLLGYFKYADFFITNINALFAANLTLLHLVLPLAISFFTFQQIAYLVDCFLGKASEHSLINYGLFVSFFPQLIAGPIVHHKEMMPQFESVPKINYRNLSVGLMVFALGLFKKVVIADNLAVGANAGFACPATLSFFEAWISTLCYTFQIYFDFSGYTDMAIGSASMLNIRLPLNFNSPYKAMSIRDFWRRWHMTLSRWLRDYLYVPLGGNRKGGLATYRNLLLTFLLGGLWHGAGWTFVIWGALHGLASAIHRCWHSLGFKMPRPAGWLTTFLCVHVAWVFFRAANLEDALSMLKGLCCANGLGLPIFMAEMLPFLNNVGLDPAVMPPVFKAAAVTVVISALIAFLARNSIEIRDRFEFSLPCLAAGVVTVFSAFVAGLYLNVTSEFLYFQF